MLVLGLNVIITDMESSNTDWTKEDSVTKQAEVIRGHEGRREKKIRENNEGFDLINVLNCEGVRNNTETVRGPKKDCQSNVVLIYMQQCVSDGDGAGKTNNIQPKTHQILNSCHGKVALKK